MSNSCIQGVITILNLGQFLLPITYLEEVFELSEAVNATRVEVELDLVNDHVHAVLPVCHPALNYSD
jgi:hypothetical protein